MKTINRRKFSTRIGYGILGVWLASLLPNNFINKISPRKKIKIKINPSAVSRKNRVNLNEK